MTPEQVQYWVNLTLAIIAGIGVVGGALITMIFSLLKSLKEKQKEMQGTADQAKQWASENYGTLNALKDRVEAQSQNARQQSANLIDVAKAVPPAAPSTIVVAPAPVATTATEVNP